MIDRGEIRQLVGPTVRRPSGLTITGAAVSACLNQRLSAAGLFVVLCFAVIAAAAPLLSPYDPSAIDPVHRLEGVSATHLLGTDNLGRDVMSRIVHGARWTLGGVTVATLAIVSIGITVGTAAGYSRGKTGELLMRIVDVILAFPGLLLALAIAGTLGPGLASVMIGLIVVGWAGYARIVRGLVMELRDSDFVAASRALGASDWFVVRTHIIRNILPAVVVLATLEMGELILAIAGFGFLGLGAQSPAPEWGAMINDARAFVLDEPRLVVVPGLAIGTLVAGFNLLGDGLRDALDPRGRRSGRGTRHEHS